ncbi:hypothetical protein BDB00DRAFT_868813 [Zychaea mexicana]|uniref:uncharacterized protein n=1 Tax=Zychaea mexicana TaxID=64656 RepID=UPI0022FE4593|nr:uncharacterized protein BDB00DRAFT_868813 [Zychaea mexicana]KAI9496971.1 hypothetical protein BDB00DRAFT_868813 [Zychaea mexicana]
MALFIGRIPKSMSTRELESIFTKYGKITRLDVKTDFGFVEFEDKRDAEEAMNEIHGKELVVEWAKNNGKRPNENECFNCGKDGVFPNGRHWAKDCREKPRGDRRGPRRDFGRDRRGGGRDRDFDRRDRRRDDRDRSPRRDRDRDYGSERRSRRDDRERSPGPERRQ